MQKHFVNWSKVQVGSMSRHVITSGLLVIRSWCKGSNQLYPQSNNPL
jgi:hypothetical protein